jgi:amphi-Trp domain-containing protein
LRQFIAKIRRLADDLEARKRFTIRVAGERIMIPADAVVNIEHEREGAAEELEFQIKWKAAEPGGRAASRGGGGGGGGRRRGQ